jgi:hypothetical protein
LYAKKTVEGRGKDDKMDMEDKTKRETRNKEISVKNPPL